MPEAIYTAEATSSGGGRNGHVRSSDGIIDLEVKQPPALGGPGGATNPEQLFAAGWASCFLSALKMGAAQQEVALTDSTVAVEVSLAKGDDGGLGLSADFTVTIAGVSQADAEDLTAAAHEVCPYSVATRGNIPVAFTTVIA